MAGLDKMPLRPTRCGMKIRQEGRYCRHSLIRDGHPALETALIPVRAAFVPRLCRVPCPRVHFKKICARGGGCAGCLWVAPRKIPLPAAGGVVSREAVGAAAEQSEPLLLQQSEPLLLQQSEPLLLQQSEPLLLHTVDDPHGVGLPARRRPVRLCRRAVGEPGNLRRRRQLDPAGQ